MDCRTAEERLRVAKALTANDPALQREVLSLLALTEDLDGDEPNSPPFPRTDREGNPT